VSNSGSGAIELVFSVKNEQDIESSNNFWVWSIIKIGYFSIHHV